MNDPSLRTERPASSERSDWSNRRRLAIIVLLSLGVHLFMMLNTTVVSRDCIVFSRYALHLEEPSIALDGEPASAPRGAIRKAEHPPGYAATVLWMSWLVRPFMGTTPQSMALSAQLVSVCAALLLIFPMFDLARRLFDGKVAFAATAIYQVLPVFMEVTIDGISDGLFLMTAVFALWFAVRALELSFSYQAYFAGFGAGLCCGIGYLVRPDAMIVGVTIGLTYAGAVLRRAWPKDTRRTAWRPFWAGIGLSLGVATIFVPYVQLIGRFTNKPSGNEVLGQLYDTLFGSKSESKPTYYDRNNSFRTVNVPLAAWWDPVAFKDQNQKVWATKELFLKEYPKAAHYALPFFALVGVWAYRRQWRDARYAMLLLLAFIHCLILWKLAAGVGYVSQRHTLLTVFVTALFGAAAFPIVGQWLLRGKPGDAWKWGGVWAIIVVLSCLPRDFRSLHKERAGHKAAGLWLAAHGDPNIPVLDPYGWSDFYAGRTLRHWTRTNPYLPNQMIYAIVEPNAKSPHSRLPWFVETQRMKSGELLFQYPANVPPEQVQVAIYKSPSLKP